MHHNFILTNLAHLSHLSYPGIFLAILASGHVVPIPEGVTILLLGYLAGIGKGSIVGFAIVSILATTFFDLALYSLTLGGARVAATLSKKVEGKMTEKYIDASEPKIFGLVFASHFVPGWRLLNPVVAAVIRIPWHKFLLYSVISCAVYAPLYLLVGYVFHARILTLVTAILSLGRLSVFSIVAILAIAALAYFSFEKKK
ncbi:MAG: rane-associated protein SNARE-like [Parcubacteria group bacterium]|nr:rane-associated protein SNARE-like [Parcubacteria group bacterium]